MSPELFSGSIEQKRIEEWVDVVGTLDSECKLRMSDNGWSVAITDPANVAFVDSKLSRSGFASYGGDWDDDEQFVYGANLSRINEVVSFATSDSTVNFILPDEHGMEMRGSDFSYNLSGIDPKTIRKEPEIPDFESYTVVDGLPAEELSRAVKAADMVSDYITLTSDVDEGAFGAHSSGDTDDVDVALTEEADSLNIGEDTRVMLSLEYLKDMTSAIPSGVDVKLALRTDFPVSMEFTHADGNAQTAMMLAPRIES